MRVTGSILALSFLVSAAPAFAQGGGSYDSGNPYHWQSQNRYEYYPQQGPMRYGSGQTQQGPWQQGGSWQQGPWQQGQAQQGPWQQQGGNPPYQNAPYQSGQMGQSPPGPVSFSTQNQIRHSLESSGFKNVTVLPQSYLIRATAPDGSHILMQVSSEGLMGVVVNPTAQARPGGTGGSASSGGNTTAGSASSTGGSSGGTTSSSSGNTAPGNPGSSTGNTGTGDTSAGNTGSTGGTSSTGSTSGTGSASGTH